MGATQTTKYMDFAGALKALKDGKKVRREAWFECVKYIYLVTLCRIVPEIMCYRAGHVTSDHWYGQANDFYAEDWTIVE